MVNLTIDNTPVTCAEGTTIMDAAASVGIPIPHLCYLKDLNEIAACRICVVEVEGTERLVPACDNAVQEGMVVHTNSPAVREARHVNMQLLMSQHNGQCFQCVRSGNCSLQSIANELNIIDNVYPQDLPRKEWSADVPLIRDDTKCIKCMRCVQVCDKVQDLHIWDIEGTGGRTKINVSLNRDIKDADCAFCGQCVINCPTAALRERDDTQKVYEALADPDKVVVCQVAPAVRSAWGEDFGLNPKDGSEGRMVACLKKLGFDYVFDTNFAADMTIMEEASEFLEQITHPDEHKFPMFTSCCPGWVRFMKSQFPDMTGQLSTTKSPHQMFGATIKSYFAELINVDPKNVFVVSIMPCLAKKAEVAEPNQNDAVGSAPDVDVSLTTREMNRMIKCDHIIPMLLKEEAFDEPLGIASGAGQIFGVTGGVMEAALRTAYFAVTGSNPDPDAFKDVRGLEGWKEASFEINGTPLRVAVASGLGNTRKLIEAIKAGKVQYDFVEIMACPGGCSNGGGLPIHDGFNMTAERGAELYGLDINNKIRFSHENPGVKKLYDDYFGKPLSEKAEHLLHTDHFGWEMPLRP